MAEAATDPDVTKDAMLPEPGSAPNDQLRPSDQLVLLWAEISAPVQLLVTEIFVRTSWTARPLSPDWRVPVKPFGKVPRTKSNCPPLKPD